MQRKAVFEQKFARFGKNMLIFVLLSILVIPIILNLAASPISNIQTHKIFITKNSKSTAYQGTNVLYLAQSSLLQSRFSSRSEYNANKEKGSTKKVTVNLSIDEDIVKSLRNDAKVKGVSLNARINGVLAKYINCYQKAEDYESCIITSKQFSLFLEMLDEEKTAEIMKYEGTSDVVSFFRHRNIPLTLDSIIEFMFENIAINSGVCYKFSQHINEGFRTLVFDHRYGIKWSRIISKVFSSLLEEICNVHTSVNLLPNAVLIKILEKDA